MTISVAVAVISTVLSGLLGALVSIIVYGRREQRRFKVDTLKRFAANRYDVKGEEFTRALNEIFVVFNDAPNVMGVLEDFHEKTSNEALITLYKAMCRDTKVKYDRFNDSFFLKPFNTEITSQLPIPDYPDTATHHPQKAIALAQASRELLKRIEEDVVR